MELESEDRLGGRTRGTGVCVFMLHTVISHHPMHSTNIHWATTSIRHLEGQSQAESTLVELVSRGHTVNYKPARAPGRTSKAQGHLESLARVQK